MKRRPKAPNKTPIDPMNPKQALHPKAAIMITLKDERPLPRYGAAVRMDVAVETLFDGK